MASILSTKIISEIKSSGLRLVTPLSIGKLIKIGNLNTIYKMIGRMEKHGQIKRIAKGKYILTELDISDFGKAGLLVSPSYISLESALSFYGILSQFPYTITSITTKKTKKVNLNDKEYDFVHISNKMLWGYVKTDDFLIATPEKALIDTIYLLCKGIRKLDLTELDLSQINKEIFKKHTKKINFIPFRKYLERIAII